MGHTAQRREAAAVVRTDYAAPMPVQLDHPVVDGDGHIVESLPIVIDYIRRVAGSDVADRFAGSSPAFASRRAPLLTEHRHRPAPGNPITPWWALPADTLDRATGLLPQLLYERLDEIGIDFTVLYSSVGLACIGQVDDAIRHGACRGLNTYLAEMLDGFGDRMTAAAVIPTHTPDEAIAELDHVVKDLGFKAVMLNSFIARPLPERGEGAQWLDVLALDSIYDYDPVWARCVELGLAVTVHSPSQGLGLRASSSRYMFNHIGNFAASSDAFAKAVFFGGVGYRFPTLNFAFLECGVSWGVQLLCDLVDRWHKRGGANIERLDPKRLDSDEWDRLLVRYGGDRFADAAVRRATLGQSDNPPDDVDDFRACGVTTPADIVGQFGRFFFGCEADDATIAWAYADRVNPLGATLQPMLGSDIGHWDVPDMRDVLPEAFELVEHELLSLAQFREFSCDNAIRLHGGMNPHFFDGTRVEAYANALLGRADVPA
ncbi:MAG: amidohydrolase [Actinobacteria bacterium]|nr:MAG: amidohydrolase [Actinomycetota bacterium]